MNTLAGWGFATLDAMAHHLGVSPAKLQKADRKRGGPHRTKAEFEAYAAILTGPPSVADVRRYFLCSRPSAYNYRRKVVVILDARCQA